MTKNEKLKQSRMKKGLTQAELASLLGVKQAYISGIETSQTFGIKKAKEIAKLLDVDPVWLYNDDKIDVELSNKSHINLKETNKDVLIGDINLKDIAQLNTELTHDENSTFPIKLKDDTGEWKKLYLISQQRVSLLNQEVALLNQEIVMLNQIIQK